MCCWRRPLTQHTECGHVRKNFLTNAEGSGVRYGKPPWVIMAELSCLRIGRNDRIVSVVPSREWQHDRVSHRDIGSIGRVDGCGSSAFQKASSEPVAETGSGRATLRSSENSRDHNRGSDWPAI